MWSEEFLLSLKANQELFNFIQQGVLLLVFASSVISYFAFKGDTDNDFAPTLKIVSYIMWALAFIFVLVVLLSYLTERRYAKSRNAWGETAYEIKVTGKKTRLKQNKRKTFKYLHDSKPSPDVSISSNVTDVSYNHAVDINEVTL